MWLEKKRRKKKLELEQDISIHPLNYFDPFTAKWSYQEFREDTLDQGKYPTLREMYDYFTKPPADQESDPLMLGGMYSVDANFATKPIRSGEDQEEFYEGLYKYWEDYAKENEADLSSLEKRRIELRQRAYRLHKNKEKERDERLNHLLSKVKLEEAEKKLEEEKRAKYPSWVIKDDNTYNLCEGSESYYQRKAKFIPLDEGNFYEYGLISPTGDFYACTWASHNTASLVLCKQLGYIDEKKGYVSLDLQDEANDLLYDSVQYNIIKIFLWRYL